MATGGVRPNKRRSPAAQRLSQVPGRQAGVTVSPGINTASVRTGSMRLLLLLLLACGAARGLLPGTDKCTADRLVTYRLVLDTHWTRELFPKQYPETRPPAQWSKLVGRCHDASFRVFREGEQADLALRIFSSTGQSDGLEALSQSHAGVFDEFSGAAIPAGRGRAEAGFFSDGNHSLVSVVVRIIPSPDWFIGLDSVDLCHKGYWIDALSLEVGPMDAGADDGFTFSAPNWPSDPRARVTRITARRPSHPANSFYYPDKRRLPALATFHFFKEKVYRLSGARAGQAHDAAMTVDQLEGARQDMSNDVPRVPAGRRPKHGKGRRRALACRAGAWSPWTACSASCGVGESSRTRTVVQHARRGGRPCPPLAETRWCGGHTACPQDFFNCFQCCLSWTGDVLAQCQAYGSDFSED
ncbi:spondin-2-like [Bacillus rossius redtenbacheri]|uniref:spondin-2-like n=1 Tax=Bacillus rossius redtenbacheri TaxID=93214 RepID=UPI002FDD758B